MMQCRMCSQRLTRPGRLCRECECELQRAQQVGVALDELVPVATPPERSRMAAGPWAARLRSPASVVAIAFAIGIVATVTVHGVDEAAVVHASVMFDPPARAVRHVSIVSAGAAGAQAVPVAASATVNVSSPSVAAGTASANSSTGAPTARVRVRAPVRTAAADAPEEMPAATVRTGSASAASDPAAALRDALGRCGAEPFLARPACEERARARYCGDAPSLPQCAPVTRDYGQ